MKIDIEISYRDIAEKIPYFELLSFDLELNMLNFQNATVRNERITGSLQEAHKFETKRALKN